MCARNIYRVAAGVQSRNAGRSPRWWKGVSATPPLFGKSDSSYHALVSCTGVLLGWKRSGIRAGEQGASVYRNASAVGAVEAVLCRKVPGRLAVMPAETAAAGPCAVLGDSAKASPPPSLQEQRRSFDRLHHKYSSRKGAGGCVCVCVYVVVVGGLPYRSA